jgi:hypothetical protein
MFVCVAMSSSEITSHLKTKLVHVNLESKASCALDHSSLPNNVHINHCDMLRLIWWDLIAVADARGGQWGPRPHLDFYKLLYIDLDI